MKKTLILAMLIGMMSFAFGQTNDSIRIDISKESGLVGSTEISGKISYTAPNLDETIKYLQNFDLDNFFKEKQCTASISLTRIAAKTDLNNSLSFTTKPANDDCKVSASSTRTAMVKYAPDYLTKKIFIKEQEKE
ncbi:MAG: hypothetical protein LBT29_07845 [Flavobacteriaceae bacterium]|jgi:hypothetical protein|nr:hypothetical protein [Flavobacteriaceae bacterium]